MNLEGVTLKLLLTEQDKDVALAAYSALRPEYLSEAFKSVFKAVTDFYDSQGYVPSINELALYRGRDTRTTAAISAIQLIETDGIDINFAINELANQFAQNTTLELFEKVLDKISLMDRHELLEHVASIPLKLEDCMQEADGVFTLNNLDVFEPPEDLAARRFPSGISNQLDSSTGGFYLEDLILLGGKRGSGKSLVAANLCANQSREGNVSVYITIEMTAKETLDRMLSMLTGIEFSKFKQGTLTPQDKEKLADYLASRYEGGAELLAKFRDEFGGSFNYQMFEAKLKRECSEKEDGKIIILDNREPSLAWIDTKIAGIRSRYGSKFKLAVVDYVNQVKLTASAEDMYDWKDQVSVSKGLKNIARKHGVTVVSPYQIDDSGEARFSKGLLDACDAAYLIKAGSDKENGDLSFITAKSRSADDTGIFRVKMQWAILLIDPREVTLEEETEDRQEEKVLPRKKKAIKESPAELELR